MPKISRVKLTKRTVGAASAHADSAARDGTFVWDSEVRGFGVRVYGSGKKVFLYQYQSPAENRTRRLTLGAFPAVTAEDARARAIHAAGVVASGRDPKGDDTEALQQRTLAEAFPLYLAERRGKIAPRTMTEYERLWDKTLAPTFGARRVAAVAEDAVARWHSDRRATPTLANRAVDLLSSFFSWAERRGGHPKPATCGHLKTGHHDG